jgi:hypothetical protein
VIGAAIVRIAQELNLTLRRRTQSTEDLVVVSNLLELDGTVAPQSMDKVAAFLVNVEREPTLQRGLARIDRGADRVGLVQPPVHLNLLVMFAANFSGTKYPEALKLISHTAAFFQANPVFDQQNTPGLDPGIDRLTLEIENLNLADLGNLWGVLGSRYLPSILYRMRMIVIDSARLEAQAPRVVRTEVEAVGGA